MEESKSTQLDLADVISATWKIYSGNFKTIVIIILIIYIPLNSVLFLISASNYSEISLSTYINIMNVLETLIGIVASMAITFITLKAGSGQNLNFSEALGLSAKRWGAAVATRIVQGFITVFLLLLLVVPGVIWLVYYSFADQVVALRSLSGKEALDYSKHIVKGSWWRTLGYSLAIGLIPGAFGIVLSLVTSFATDSYLGLGPLEIFINTIIDIMSAFTTVGMTVLFLKMENLKPEDYTEKTAFEVMNDIVHKDSKIDDEAEMVEKDQNDIDDDENVLRCSVCGIKVAPDDLVCPMCHSVIRHDSEQHEEGDYKIQ